MKWKPLAVAASLLLTVPALFAGTTGKIAGRITDVSSKEPLIGVNVFVLNTTLGATTDLDGYYCILNVPPGTYDVRISHVGYQPIVKKLISVSADRTTEIDFELTAVSIPVDVIEVVAQREAIVRDRTSTVQNISSEDIKNLPVENVGDILQLQAGITRDAAGNLHMRGGRESEVRYYVDGMLMINPFNGDNAFGNMQNDNVQELQVISGTFNAEYGQAMSGVVNIITKEGGERTTGSITAYSGDFVSSRKDVFRNIDNINPLAQKYIEGYVAGPLPFAGDRIQYRLSGRYRHEENWLYGTRHYLVSDTADFSATDPANWKVQHSGDESYVPMNPYEAISIMGKVSYRIQDNVKLVYSYMGERSEWKGYSHLYSLTPDHNRTNYATSTSSLLILTHTISPTAFQELKLSYESFDQEAHVRSNPYDPIYDAGIPRVPASLTNVFAVGTVDPTFLERSSGTAAVKYELTSQVDRYNLLKGGAEWRLVDVKENTFQVRKDAGTNWQLQVDPRTSLTHNYYRRWPLELNAYVQDKVEVEDFIVNVGFRFDYFDARAKVPQFTNDPHNNDTISHPKYSNDVAYKPASAKMQISPRLGLAFPISENGNIHASYGHFFQIPELQRLYENPEFEVAPGHFTSFLGNANLEAQRTVVYEIGIQQRVASNLVVNGTCFYKDYRNLAGASLYRTFDQDEYGMYSNKDYGNVWGITIALDFLKSGMFSANVDYTYQVAEGNGSDPIQAFLDAQRNDESTRSLVPLNWDQRNVLNAIVNIDGDAWGIRSISRYATGVPYTPATVYERTADIQLMNQGRRRSEFNMDLRLYYRLPLAGAEAMAFVSVENVFDAERIDLKPEISAEQLRTHESRAFLNSLYDFLFNPGSQPRPRLVKFGFQVTI